jgi:hypothetical protein
MCLPFNPTGMSVLSETPAAPEGPGATVETECSRRRGVKNAGVRKNEGASERLALSQWLLGSMSRYGVVGCSRYAWWVALEGLRSDLNCDQIVRMSTVHEAEVEWERVFSL